MPSIKSRKSNLGSTLLCITNDNKIINWWNKLIDFLKIKFHLNENIGQHGMHLELNLNLIQVDLGSKQDEVDTKSECLSFTLHHAY